MQMFHLFRSQKVKSQGHESQQVCVGLQTARGIAAGCVRKPRETGKRKGKEDYLHSAFYILCISQSAQAWITQFDVDEKIPWLQIWRTLVHQ